jgi:putative flippase GtrA
MKRLGTQLARFVIVGGAATLFYVSSALLLHGVVGLTPLWANFLAFALSWALSYAGNFVWTFGAASVHNTAMPRHLILSVSLFTLNQAFVYLSVEVWGWRFWAALIPVLLVLPLIGFLAGRFWAFRPRT